ncbi:MAG: hypothetical protein LBQ15_08215 [Clostridium sp.]|jgi:hypothetical protein|nr:hypothetical protein [Clostridium sp.]
MRRIGRAFYQKLRSRCRSANGSPITKEDNIRKTTRWICLAATLLFSTGSATASAAGQDVAEAAKTTAGTLLAEFSFSAEETEDLILGYQNLKTAVANNLQPVIDEAASDTERAFWSQAVEAIADFQIEEYLLQAADGGSVLRMPLPYYTIQHRRDHSDH